MYSFLKAENSARWKSDAILKAASKPQEAYQWNDKRPDSFTCV